MILAERNQITPDTRPWLCVSREAIHVTSGEYVHWMNEPPMKCESKTRLTLPMCGYQPLTNRR